MERTEPENVQVCVVIGGVVVQCVYEWSGHGGRTSAVGCYCCRLVTHASVCVTCVPTVQGCVMRCKLCSLRTPLQQITTEARACCSIKCSAVSMNIALDAATCSFRNHVVSTRVCNATSAYCTSCVLAWLLLSCPVASCHVSSDCLLEKSNMPCCQDVAECSNEHAYSDTLAYSLSHTAACSPSQRCPSTTRSLQHNSAHSVMWSVQQLQKSSVRCSGSR